MSSACDDGRCWIATGAVFAFLAVFAGAFGAHGLKDTGFLKDKYEGQTKNVAGQEVHAAYKYLGDFEVGVGYQMLHAVGLILLGLFAGRFSSKFVKAAGWCFALGTILFSGSLYVLVIGGLKAMGAVAPIGGTLQLIGWALFAMAAVRATAK
ncbi:MAG: DUF423 domain-containing protein [Planctomycetaceae bacterium]